MTDASALTSTLLTVEFSEDIVLPSGAASAFSIESAEGEMLEIYDAYLSDDPTVVFVVTAEQTAGAQYILTAGIDIEDEAGNPIVSGTSDTAVFTGSAVDEMVDEDMDENEVEDEVTVPVGDGFMLELVDSVELNELVLTFSEEVGNADPDSFTIQLLDNALIDVPVLAVSIDDEDASVVTLVTEDMEAGYEYMLSIDDLVLNKDGAALSGDSEGYEFVALTLDLADLVAPEDVTDLLASAVDETTALVSWTASIDSAGDLAEYLVYRSVDGTTFGPSMSVDKALAEYEEDNLTPGATYTYKVTAKDVNNNESDGELVTITLPETGPAMAALFGLSLLGAGAVTRRRKEF